MTTPETPKFLKSHNDSSDMPEAYEEDEDFAPEQVTRWKRMSAAALVLLAVVAYLYETKIDAPIERLEQNIESQVVNRPQPTQQVLQVPDEAPQKPDLTLVNSAKAANPLNDGVLSASVTCPAGTTRMIYIDDQALCCQGKQCSEAQ
jgi:hypothetical protein